MIECVHYDDCKGKWQSHEVYIKTNDDPYYIDGKSLPYDPTDIVGYGETKEEAFEEFKEKFNQLFAYLKEFSEKINSPDVEIKDI